VPKSLRGTGGDSAVGEHDLKTPMFFSVSHHQFTFDEARGTCGAT
jgi:hypothetical protein